MADLFSPLGHTDTLEEDSLEDYQIPTSNTVEITLYKNAYSGQRAKPKDTSTDNICILRNVQETW